MSTPYPHLSGPFGGIHPARLSVRRRELMISGLAGLLALAIALGVTVAMPKPNYPLVFGGVLGLAAVVALATHARLEVSVAVLALYVGLIEGPLKLLVYSQAVSAVRDVLIGVVAIGALVRLRESGRRVRLPPLSGWVFLFVALVFAEAFNPNTQGIVKAIGGFRQQLEWVPFFFFGYALMRSRARFRKLFVILGVVALANGAVSTYQTRLSPSQLASWGPGYSELVHGSAPAGGSGGITGRQYVSEGVAHVRPTGLGSEAGFGGGMGVLALTGALALLATAKRRRRWIALVFCLGAILAVATALARLSAVGAVIAVVAFVMLSLSAGRRVSAPLGALAVVGLLALPLGAVLVSNLGSGVFSRYESIAPTKVVEHLHELQGSQPRSGSARDRRRALRSRPGDGRRRVGLRRPQQGLARRPRLQRGDAVQLPRRRTGSARAAAVERARTDGHRPGRGGPTAHRERRRAHPAGGHVRPVHRIHRSWASTARSRGCRLRLLFLVRDGHRRLLVPRPRTPRGRARRVAAA